MKHIYPDTMRFLCWLLLCLAATMAQAQAPAWQTTIAFRPDLSTPVSGNLDVIATATDAAGDIYLCGTFNGTAVFGPFLLASSRNYGYDVFVAKWNPRTNTFAWAQRAGGGGTMSVTSLAVQGSSVYLAGSFFESATFGATTLTCASNRNDVYVAKLTDAGTSTAFTWAVGTQTNGSLFETRDAYLTASNNSLYLATNFVGAATLGGRTLFSAGYNDVLVAKLTDAGSSAGFTWAQRAGGAFPDYAYAVAVAGDNVYVAGASSGSADFGSTILSGGNGVVGFVAKLTDAGPTGSFTWAHLAGQYAYALATSGTSVYLAGTFVGAATLGSLSVSSSGSSVASYVTKLTDAGPTSSFTWAQVASGPNNCFVFRLAASGPNVYATGAFYQAVQVGNTTLTSYGRYDGLLVKLLDAGSTGSIAWAQQAGGPNNDGLGSILLLNGSVYVGGGMKYDMQFGRLALTAVEGSTNGFLASVTDATLLATASPAQQFPLQVFPNPARGVSTVRLPIGIMATSFVLNDALGRTVRCRFTPAAALGTAELDLTGLAPGVYTLRTKTFPTFITRLVVE
jgi:hypothetical protein